jgi:hypothetical protein
LSLVPIGAASNLIDLKYRSDPMRLARLTTRFHLAKARPWLAFLANRISSAPISTQNRYNLFLAEEGVMQLPVGSGPCAFRRSPAALSLRKQWSGP